MFQRTVGFLSLLLAFVFVLAPSQARGQGVPWSTIPLPIPKGFVDAITGNVHLEIPLASMPQRNSEPIVSKMVYDTAGYYYLAGYWNATGLGWRNPTGTSHTATNAGPIASPQSCISFLGANTPYTQGLVWTWSGFPFWDIHGTRHALPDGDYTRQVSCSTPQGQDFGTSLDITSISDKDGDGLGYAYQITNYNKMKITASDGTIMVNTTGDQFSSDTPPVDPNGNTGLGFAPNLSSGLPGAIGCPGTPPTYTGTSTYTTSGGSSATYTYTCTPQNVSYVSNGTTYTGSQSLLTTLALPDGTSYSFGYDTGTTGNHPGTLLSVTLPTGGTITFTYTGLAGPGLQLKAASVSFGGGTWSLTYVPGTPTSSQTTITVMSPLRYDSVSGTNVSDRTDFITITGGLPILQTAKYYAGSSTLLKTVDYTYTLLLPTTVKTTLNDTGQSSQVLLQYFNGLRNFISQRQETDFNGTIVKTTKTNYTSGSFIKPSSLNVYAGSGTGSPVASTLYTYDEYTANYCNGVPMLATVAGAYGHDDSNFGRLQHQPRQHHYHSASHFRHDLRNVPHVLRHSRQCHSDRGRKRKSDFFRLC